MYQRSSRRRSDEGIVKDRGGRTTELLRSRKMKLRGDAVRGGGRIKGSRREARLSGCGRAGLLRSVTDNRQ